MCFPQPARFPKVMRNFYEVAEFPDVTGYVDCTHVRIISPGGDDAEVFHNRKGYFLGLSHSFVLQTGALVQTGG